MDYKEEFRSQKTDSQVLESHLVWIWEWNSDITEAQSVPLIVTQSFQPQRQSIYITHTDNIRATNR